MSKAKFTWDAWDFDCDGDAYVIAKRECPEKEDVPDYIVKEDCLHPDCKAGMVVKEGWCKYQVRTDWENRDGEPTGGYFVETYEPLTKKLDGKKKVWLVPGLDC